MPWILKAPFAVVFGLLLLVLVTSVAASECPLSAMELSSSPQVQAQLKEQRCAGTRATSTGLTMLNPTPSGALCTACGCAVANGYASALDAAGQLSGPDAGTAYASCMASTLDFIPVLCEGMPLDQRMCPRLSQLVRQLAGGMYGSVVQCPAAAAKVAVMQEFKRATTAGACAALEKGDASKACRCACELNAKVVPALVYSQQTSDPAAPSAEDGSADEANLVESVQPELSEACYQTVLSALEASGGFTAKAVHAILDCNLQQCQATVTVSSSMAALGDDSATVDKAVASRSSRLVDSASTKIVSSNQARSSSSLSGHSSSSSVWLLVMSMLCAAVAAAAAELN